jgi:hypothetical protein
MEFESPFAAVPTWLPQQVVPAVRTVHQWCQQSYASLRQSMDRNPQAFYWVQWPEKPLPSLRECVVGSAEAVGSIHPNYWAVAFLSVCCFFVMYIKLRYPFWNQVAALHTFDWHRRYVFRDRPYTIRLLPNKTRYHDARSIETGFFRQLPPEKLEEMTTLLQNHYMPSDRLFSSFGVPEFAAYFVGHSHPPIVSLFYEIVQEQGKSIELPTEGGVAAEEDPTNVDVATQIRQMTRKHIQGFVTSRPLTVSLLVREGGTAAAASSVPASAAETIVSLPVYYMDFLCMRREVAASSPFPLRTLFATHEYNQRCLHAGINVTLFRREVELCEGLVPLLEFDTHTFYLPPRVRTPPLPQNFQMVRIQREYQHHLHDFLGKVASLREEAGGHLRFSAVADIGALLHLLRSNQLFAYVLRGPEDGTIGWSLQQPPQPPTASKSVRTKLDAAYALYFFRNEQVKYDDLDGGDTVRLAGAFCNTNNRDLFFAGFLMALQQCVKDMGGAAVRMLMLDDLGHGHVLLRRWLQRYGSAFVTRCAYYLCNYVVPRSPLDPHQCFVLC